MTGGPRLAELLPKDMFLGTSLILRGGRKPTQGMASLLYGVRAPKAEGGQQVLEVTGIGGRLEGDDASPAAGVLREALEETGCRVRLLRCRETLVVRSQRDVMTVKLSGARRPAAVVFRHYGTPPRDPWSDKHSGAMCVVVFAGELRTQPHPAMELPALIWLTTEQVVQLARRDVVLQGVLDGGAELVEERPQSVPRNALLRLVDSQEALVQALGNNALAFYTKLLGDAIA